MAHKTMKEIDSTPMCNTSVVKGETDCTISKRTLTLTPLSPPSVATASKPVVSDILAEEENGSDSEEKRLNYFLDCFNDVVPAIEDEEGTDNGIGNDCLSDMNCEGGRRENAFCPPEPHGFKLFYTTSTENMLVENDDAVHSGPTRESLLNDRIVLQSLRSSLKAGNRHHLDVDVNDTPNTNRPTQHRQYQHQRDQEHHQQQDPTVSLFFKFFKFAQSERLRKPHNRPYMILGLFSNLSDIRSDLEWAQDATYRRQAGKPYIAWADYYTKERQGSLMMPIFTSLTLVVCTCLMVWAFYMNEWKVEPMKTNPLIGPSPQVLLELGALQGRTLIEDNKWWLLVTPIFLHAGVVHILLNGLFLVFICRTIERNHGWVHTSIVFLSSGMFGNLLSALLQPGYILVGASGGIYGLIGACVADIVLNSRFFFLVLEERVQEQARERERDQSGTNGNENQDSLSTERMAIEVVRTDDPDAMHCRRRRVQLWCYFSLVCDLLLNSLVGLLPFVDNFAHLGGLIFGFFVSLSSLGILSGSSFDYHEKREKTSFGRWCHRLRILALRCGGLLSALCLVFVAMFFLGRSDGVTIPCPNCRYASCIALPRPWKPNDPDNWWTCDECGGVTAQVYPGTGINEGVFIHVEIFCPRGDAVDLDISNERYTVTDQVNAILPDLCRRFCEL